MAMLPDGKLARSSDLVKGNPIPAVKVSGPLRVSDIPPDALGQMKAGAQMLAQSPNEPPRDKSPPDGSVCAPGRQRSGAHRRPSTWSNTKSSRACGPAGEERTPARRHAADRPDPWNTGRGLTARRQPRSGTQAGPCCYGGDVAQRKLIVATRSGHHVQLDEPELVVTRSATRWRRESEGYVEPATSKQVRSTGGVFRFAVGLLRYEFLHLGLPLRQRWGLRVVQPPMVSFNHLHRSAKPCERFAPGRQNSHQWREGGGACGRIERRISPAAGRYSMTVGRDGSNRLSPGKPLRRRGSFSVG